MEQWMKRAVLLLNMGGPSSISEVEMFLRNMFADRYILQTNPLMRKLIGNIIVAKRLNEAQDNYRQIGGKSPLLDITNSLASKISEKLGVPAYPVMRYVPPFAKDVLPKLKEQGVEELLLFSMYPHYSSTTTKSSIEDIEDALKELNWQPKIKIVGRYYNDLEYIKIQANLIEQALNGESSEDKKLIISAHGLPLDIIKKGDPYEKEITVNFELIKAELAHRGVKFKEVELAYQSKVGNGTWLEPNLSDVLRNPTNLNVLIFPIAFTIDNSETIFELDIEHREIAEKIGYDWYKVAKCPNDSEEFSNFLESKLRVLI